MNLFIQALNYKWRDIISIYTHIQRGIMEISNFQMIHIQGNWKSQLLGNITRYIHNSAVASITSVESEILVSSIKVVQAKHYPTLPVSMHPIFSC